MSDKYSFISALAEKTSKKLSYNPREWKAFLRFTARFYKYPFTDQLLIYAQRPDAMACASITIWNSRMHRWVNRGSKGIALIDTAGGRPRLKYVFDVKDTNQSKNALYPQIWKLSYTNRDAVMDMLKKAYGKANSNLVPQLISIVEMSVGANYSEYLDDLMISKEESFLEDLDELNTKVLFRNTLTASVKYVVLTRCGFNADKYISEEDLKSITNFNTEQTLSYVGNACSKISAPILRQIERQVKISDRKIKPKAIENQKEREYNKFSALKRNPLEEVITNGVNIYEKRGLHDSGLEDGPAAGRETRQVRKNEGEIPQGTQERDIHVISPERQTLGTPSGNRPDSEQPHEADYRNDGKGTERKRETEGIKSNALGSGDEQHTVAGGGNNRERDNIQLSFFPTVEEQIEQINLAEDEQPSAFSIPQQDIIRALCEGSGFEGGKFRINGWFEGQHGNADTVKFLKNEYGTGGQTFKLSDGSLGNLWFNAKGFFLSHEIDTVNPEIKLTWKDVAGRLHDLVLSGRYLTQEEQNEYKTYMLNYGNNQPSASLPPDNLKPIEFTDNKQNDDTYRETDGDIPASELLTIDGQHYETVAIKAIKSEEKNDVSSSTSSSISKRGQPHNFHITDDNLGAGGQKTKYGFNIAAIRTLKQIESENRTATPIEQDTLSKYVGWGGIPQAFDEKNEKWEKEYTELKGILTDKEYEAARASVLNAHYTSPTVIKAIYDAVNNFGFKPGNILEPAMGVGNFFGLIPESMEKSKLYGVELDSITGRIAKQLYPKADITVDGFENTGFPDDFFDLALGNVPFGDYQVADRRYDKYKFHIHDYFFAKTIDKVRPGGLITFITSKGTLDKQNPEVRKYIAARADLLGAVRLPNNAFLKNAGT